VRLWKRPGERVAIHVDAPARIAGPLRRGRRLGTARIAAAGGRTLRVALVSSRSLPPPPIAGGLEDSLPGSPSRAVAAIGGLVLLTAGLLLAAGVATSPGRGRLRDRRRGAA
jgi:hypothetical protein